MINTDIFYKISVVNLTLAVFLFTFQGCMVEDSTAKTNVVATPLSARVMHPVQREIVEWDEFTGRFQASKRVNIRARVGGYIEKVAFSDGQIVKKGDVLFVIDQRAFKIAIKSAKARFELAKKRFKRTKKLVKKKMLPVEQFDQRKQEMESAQADLEQAQLNLEFTWVKAPFTGRIGQNLIDEGNVISGGTDNATLLATLVSVQPIEFYFEGSEADLLKYAWLRNSRKKVRGRPAFWPVYVKLQNEEEFTHKGRINFINNELDPNTGTIQARAEFENKAGLLEPGLFARMRLNTAPPFKALLVPDSVIGTEQTRKFVYVVGPDSKATRKYVILGRLEEDGLRSIKTGLNSADQVIVNNLNMIRSGVPITPVIETIDDTKEG